MTYKVDDIAWTVNQRLEGLPSTAVQYGGLELLSPRKDLWEEGDTWKSIWGVPYDVEVTLASHYHNTCTFYDHRKTDILEAKQRAEMRQ